MIRKVGFLTAALLVIVLAINVGDTQATVIDIGIQNAGFEDRYLKEGRWPGTDNSASDRLLPHWQAYTLGVNYDVTYGVWNPAPPPVDDYPGSAPEGRNVGYVWTSQGETGIAGLQQTVTPTGLTAGDDYWLMVDVGNYVGSTPFAGYRIQLLAGDVLLAQDENGVAPQDGEFLTSQLAFTAPTMGDLTIRLLSLSQSAGDENWIDFDHVRISDTPLATPEPATMLLLGAGLLGLAGFGRKKLFRK